MVRAGPLALAAFLFLTLGAGWTSLEADLPEKSDRVVSYTIRAELKPALRQVHGEMTVVWRNTCGEPVSELYFHLYLNAFKDKKSTYVRESAGAGKSGARFDKEYPGWVRVNWMRREDGENLWKETFVAPDDGNPDDTTLARVDLPAPVAPGETITLAIGFDSQLPRVLHRTGWAGDPDKPDSLFFMVAQWFPKIASLRRTPEGKPRWNAHQFHRNTEFFADYGEYKVSLTVPAGFKVGASGERTAEPTRDGSGTVTYVHAIKDVHDFAWTASPHFAVEERDWTFDGFCKKQKGMGKRIRALLARTARHRGKTPDEIKPRQGVKVRILLQPGHEELAERYWRAAGASIACYGIWFGQYPYPVLTVVDPPAGGRAAGGMEYPTLITVGVDKNSPTSGIGVTIHEFGHQFFYGLIGSNEFEEAWLDEGFTSFTDARVYEVAYGPRPVTTRYGPFTTPHHRPFAAPKVFGRLSRLLHLPQWAGKIPHPWKKPDTFLPVPETNGFWAYLRDMPFLHLTRDVRIHQPYGDRNGYLRANSHDAMVMPGWHFAARGDYRANSYPKPSIFLYCLRGLMGEEAFDRAMYAYASRYRFKHPTTEDFLEVLRGHGDAEVLDAFAEAMTASAARLDVAILSASQRKLTRGKWKGKWEWTVRVQRRGDVPVPIEVWADDELLETWNSRGRATTRTFRAVRDKRFKVARAGLPPPGRCQSSPNWLRFLDADLSNNARVTGDGDGRPATVLSARWSLYVEEIMRSYAGLAR